MSLVVAMAVQLVNTSRAKCELTNRLEHGRQKVHKSQRRYVWEMEIFVWSSEGIYIPLQITCNMVVYHYI